jgi:exonuclease SbcC
LDAVKAAQLPLLQSITADHLVCRKIVLPTDRDHISEALGSLPFMSMGVGATRPAPTLQDIFGVLGTQDYPETVLNILADRANAERILARLLELPVPSMIPRITSTSLTTAGTPAASSAPCRLEALRVRNFRGIRAADIDLSANITIIYGQNGTGKTSFFDAIEWALVGAVERIDAENQDDTSGRSPYVNLFTQEPAYVAVDVSIAHVKSTVTRTFERNGAAHLSIGKREDVEDREALALIIGQQSPKLDIRTLRRLIRTTCFLSQSTLMRFLSGDPKDRYWSLAYLLGTQDYVRLLERVEEVRSIINRRVHEVDSKVEELSTELESIGVQIRSREALISNATGAHELDDMLANLMSEVSNKLSGLQSPYAALFSGGYGIYEAQSSIAIASDWVEKELRQARENKDRLLLALDAGNRRPEVSTALKELAARKAAIIAGVGRASAQLSLAEQEGSRAESELAQITRELDRLIDVQGKQREALVITQQMEGLRTLETEQQRQVRDIESELSGYAEARAQLVDGLASSTSISRQNVANAKQLRDEIKALDEAESLQITFQQLALELPSLEQTIRAADASIAEQQQIVVDLRTRTASIQREIAALVAERERQMGSVENLRGLLADIQKYLVTSECPLCGSEWHSTDALKQVVDERTNWLSPKVKQLDEQLLQMQERLSSSQTTMAQAEDAVSQASARRNEARRRSAEIKEMVVHIRELLLRAGLTSDSDTTNFRFHKDTRAADLGRITDVLIKEEGSITRLGDELSRLESEATRKEDTRQRMATRLADTRRRLNEMVAQLKGFGLGFEPDAALLRHQIQHVSHETETAESRRATAFRNSTDAQATLEGNRVAVASEERSLQENERGILALNEALRRIDYALRDAQLDADVGSESIRIKIQDSEARAKGLEGVRNTLNSLNEISSWLLARREIVELKSRLASINVTDEATKTERRTLLQWSSHLESFYAALTEIKSEVEKFQLQNYGPTINLLYKRLNTHPIFTELKVSVDASNQAVTIQLPLPASFEGTDGKGLAPAHYLSEAQLNVAALSIFLSHSFQQRWSSFEPLFLDDPVQNMDDFNANGFIDCLRSLAVLDRQFVVSTCDIGLYRLLLLKLRCMNHDGNVRFRAYRLEGIAEQGPSIVQDLPAVVPKSSSQTQVYADRVN